MGENGGGGGEPAGGRWVCEGERGDECDECGGEEFDGYGDNGEGGCDECGCGEGKEFDRCGRERGCDECGCGEGNGEGFDWYGGTGNGERECDECGCGEGNGERKGGEECWCELEGERNGEGGCRGDGQRERGCHECGCGEGKGFDGCGRERRFNECGCEDIGEREGKGEESWCGCGGDREEFDGCEGEEC